MKAMGSLAFVTASSAILAGLAMSASASSPGGKTTGPTAELPHVFLLDANSLAETHRRVAAGDKDLAPAVEALRREADKALQAGPFSVMDKTVVPPSGDKHDYMSQAPYWWPDPNNPDGPYIRRDGEVHADRAHFDNAPMGRMASAVNVLATAYYFTGHEPYAEHAAKLLRGWFLDEKTRMSPNLNYGQSIPGRVDGRGAGIIDTTCLVDLVDSVGLLADSSAWTRRDQEALQAWFAKYLTWLLESKIGREEARAGNNHGTWYDVQVASFALLAGRDDLARKTLTESHKRLEKQIEPDGRQPLELARTKSWDYSTMNLHAFFDLAALGEHVGVDLWNHRSSDGRCIRGALDYLLPYAKNAEKWPHKQIVTFKPDKLSLLLRRGAIRYGQEKYEQAIEQMPGGAKSNWRMDLLWPKRGKGV